MIRPAKRAEIDELWAEEWSFGDENGKKRVGAKVAAILTAVLVVTFAASLGVTIYQVRMGYDKFTFSLMLGDAAISIKDYSVTVSFEEDGRISAVGG